MPTPFTEASELMVAFGLLGVDPQRSTFQQINTVFAGTLTIASYNKLLNELQNDGKKKTYRLLWEIGQKIYVHHIGNTHISKIEWQGPQRQRSTISVSKDLCVNNNIYISVKTDSNVIFNLSPYNLFCSVPKGEALAANEANWFLYIAPSECQYLYDFIRINFIDMQLPSHVEEFENSAKKQTRKNIQAWLKTLNDDQQATFKQLYINMCHEVAQKSAHLFMQHLRGVRRTHMRSVGELILKYFLRLNSTPYLLVGIDSKKPFAVNVPDMTSWFRDWNFDSINALPDLSRNQSVVNFVLKFKNRHSEEKIELPYHAEIRWSHGKFCGNPEGKLYKDFKWEAVSFFDKLF